MYLCEEIGQYARTDMGVLETKRVIQQPKRRRMNKKLRTLQLVLRVSVLVAGIVALGAIIYSVGFARYTNLRRGLKRFLRIARRKPMYRYRTINA